LTPPYPRSDCEADQQASFYANLFKNRLFMDPSALGAYPSELLEILKKDKVMWEASQEEYQVVKENTIDYLGVNFYHPFRVKAPELSSDALACDWFPERYFEHYEMPGRRMNMDRGWEIFPQALYDIGENIKGNYGNLPWFVSENGMGVSREIRWTNAKGVVEDDYRIQFVTEHLYQLHKTIAAGSNCFGYHMWTPIDCWSWLNSYKNRYGFIANDVHTQIKTIKKSGYWFKKVAESDILEVPQEIVDKFMV